MKTKTNQKIKTNNKNANQTKTIQIKQTNHSNKPKANKEKTRKRQVYKKVNFLMVMVIFLFLMIVSKIAREPGGRFGFHALGLPCRGKTYKDSLAQVRHLCQYGALPTSSANAPARWTCPKCEEVNRPERDACNNCGYKRV